MDIKVDAGTEFHLVSEESFPVTPDIVRLFHRSKLAKKNRDRAIIIAKSAKMAIRFLDLHDKYKKRAWELVYNLHPELRHPLSRETLERFIPEVKSFKDDVAFEGGLSYHGDEKLVRVYVESQK